MMTNIRIAEFCMTGTGGTPSRDRMERYYEGGTIPWVKSGELRESVITDTEEYVTNTALQETNIRLVPVGALLLAMYGATVGRLGILGIPATTNQAICHIIPDPKVAETRYLFHALRSRVSHLLARRVGGAQPNISQAIVKDLPIPLPPLAEQWRIAAILDQAEALRAKRRHTLAKLDTLTQSLFLEMFGDPARHGWPEKSVAALASNIRTGPFGSQLLHSEFVDAGIAVLGIDNAVQNQFVWGRPRFIPEHKFRQLKRYQVSPGDVLITIMGTCGRCAVVPDDIPTAINTKHLCCITLDHTQCLSTYLHACFLLHPYVLHRLGIRERGAVMPGLNMQVIKELMLPIPPLPLQREFAAQVLAVERLKASQRASLAKLDALFASLQHRAFRGEL